MKAIVAVERLLGAGVVVLAIAAFSVGAFVWIDALGNDDPLYLEPQGSVRAQLAEAWNETGSPSIDLDRRLELPEDVRIALVPRDASVLDWSIVPKDFAYPMTISALLNPLGNGTLALLTPLSALVAAGLVAWIVWTLTSSWLASAGAFSTTVTSVVWWSASYGGVSYSLMGVAFGLSAVRMLIAEARRDGPGSLRLLFFAGALAGVASGFHYASAPWWGALLIVGCIGPRHGTWVVLQRLTIAASGAVLALAPVLVFNAYVYGSPTTTGYSEFATVLDAIGWSAPALGFDVDSFWSNLSTYMSRPDLIPVVLLAAWALPIVRAKNWVVRPVHGVVLILGYFLLVAVTGSATLWGTNQFRTNASFLRYMAPVFALAVVLAFVALDHMSRVRREWAVLPVVFALGVSSINIVTVAQEAEGWIDTRDLITASRLERDEFRASIPVDAFVITRRGDKVLFPERSTLIAAYLRTGTSEEGTRVHLYSTFPEIDRLADVLRRVYPKDILILNDSGWLDPHELDQLADLLLVDELCLVNRNELLISLTSCSPLVSS